MALSCTCDRCGKPAETWEERGIYEKRQYCPDCAKVYDAMEAEKAKVHGHLATRFEDEMEEIRRKYFPRKGTAPDE